jgi:hypothetical protein
MALNYLALKTKAKRLIGSNGTRCVLVNPSKDEKTYNPNTNKYEGGKPKRFIGYCVISNYSDKLVDGTVIKTGDRQIIVTTEGIPEPSLSTLEVYDKSGKVLKDTYKIINGGAIRPDAETVIVCRLQCRK